MSEKEPSNFSEKGDNVVEPTPEERAARSKKVNLEGKERKPGGTEIVNIGEYKKKKGKEEKESKQETGGGPPFTS